jgi:hypothetical protein
VSTGRKITVANSKTAIIITGKSIPRQAARAPKAKSKKATRLRIMPAPAADKALVRERDDAKAELIAWTEARERGDRVNLAVFEKKYTAACERMAKAQQKLAHGPDLRADHNFLRTLATPDPITDWSEGEAHQDRREGRHMWTSDNRGWRFICR